MSNSNDLTIQEQLAARRARLAELQNQNEHANNNHTQHNSANDDTHLSDYEYAMKLQQQFDGQHNDNEDIQMSNHNQQPNAPQQPSLIDEDHEIAMQLQRQFDAQDTPNEQPQPMQPPLGPQPYPRAQGLFFPQSNSNHNSGMPSMNSYTVTSTDSNGNTHTVHYNGNQLNNSQQSNPFGNSMSGFNHPFFQQNNNANADPFAVFQNDPFFTQNRMPSRRRNNPNNGNANPFNDPFFGAMSGMPPMVNMNMMINNMHMMNQGNPLDDSADIFDLMQHLQPHAPVATQENVDALPTDTYKAKGKKKDKPQCIVIDCSDDEEEEESKEDKNEKETCSICLEPFKDGDTIKRLPCLHIFHQHEIDRWLLTGADKCPICRMPINGDAQQQNQ